MLVFTGPSECLSSTRAKQLQRLLAAGVRAADLSDQTIYFVDCRQAPTASEIASLEQILQARQQSPAMAGTRFLVLPRKGTVSPWSSKATDILHISGLTAVKRVERGRLYALGDTNLSKEQRTAAAAIFYDRMLECICTDIHAAEELFAHPPARLLQRWPLEQPAEIILRQLNKKLALGLSDDEVLYLSDYYQTSGQAPTDAELQMFSQVNSEHCRHKIFNATWTVNKQTMEKSLFDMIRNTYRVSPQRILSAYSDNAAVMTGTTGLRWQVNPHSREYESIHEDLPILLKVETHNHPTAISPFPGAATGSGGEIRDEAAVGRGGRPKAGLCGYTVSHLRISEFEHDWEVLSKYPDWIATPLTIMLEGPVGAARFNNEFGRPCLSGYFRTFEQCSKERHWGYHKPIMLAGGFGNVRPSDIHKHKFAAGTPIAVLGGPAMLIGLAGGSASSQAGGSYDETLNYASVQRANAEMQRRCQEVIEQCTALAENNPIIAIHDVGAGGLSNAVPELLHDSGCGGHIRLRDIPVADSSLSPMEIWSNEAQERYVLAVSPQQIKTLIAMCKRERCPVAVIGYATDDGILQLEDSASESAVVEMPLSILLDSVSKNHKNIDLPGCNKKRELIFSISLDEAIERVLTLPAVAAKQFLITIGDRTVGGMTVRDQMVGPWQVPVADCAVCSADYFGYAGEAMAVGERTPLAVSVPEAAARMAVGEAITNILAADIQQLSDIRLSANWMAACGAEADDAALYSAVQAVGEELCPALGIAIPVGKDSLSMQVSWRANDDTTVSVTSPLSLIISAFAAVGDVRRCWTPQLLPREDSILLLFDLAAQKHRLGGSALAQVCRQAGGEVPDLDNPKKLISFVKCLTALRDEALVLAYHDRSDGGLLTTVCEMMFAGHCGVSLEMDMLNGDLLSVLFAEELGAVVQVSQTDLPRIMELVKQYGLEHDCIRIGTVTTEKQLTIHHDEQTRVWALQQLKTQWWQTTYRLQALRDNPACAREELQSIQQMDDPGLHISCVAEAPAVPVIKTAKPPKVAILREQGVNGHAEMAAAFARAGFCCVDIHMNDLLAKPETLRQFQVLAACGGFSYGDVLGAGRGWASSILFHQRLSEEFKRFFTKDDTLTLGVCNGCQMLSQLTALIPGSQHWPRFQQNKSEQFEARTVMVEIMHSPCVFFDGMVGAQLPVVVAHGEGRATFAQDVSTNQCSEYACMRYVDNWGKPTEQYPANPNGSSQGITGLCSEDGRALIMMPHPERLFRQVQYSWCRHGESTAPWLSLFQNARKWIGRG